jgi:hypothetical protein
MLLSMQESVRNFAVSELSAKLEATDTSTEAIARTLDKVGQDVAEI